MEEINEFKKDDYIVLLSNKYIDPSYLLNYCFKQRENSHFLSTYKDNQSSTTNGWQVYKFWDLNDTWRYATEREIRAYNKAGRPINVTELKEKSYGVY